MVGHLCTDKNTWKVEHLKGLDKCKHRERPEAAEESED